MKKMTLLLSIFLMMIVLNGCVSLKTTLSEEDLALAKENMHTAVQAQYEKDFPKALEYYQKASAQGFGPATNNLGYMYNNGVGVPQDFVKARKYYQKALSQGYAYAYYNLGVLYQYGDGVKQDFLKAKEYYEKAAKEGYTDAQYNLGMMYLKGFNEGIPKDMNKAKFYFKEACDLNDKEACHIYNNLD